MNIAAVGGFREYLPPEQAPPQAVIVGGAELEIASKIWRIDGKISYNANIDEKSIPINKVENPENGLKIRLSTARYPMFIEFRTFDKLNQDGIPQTNIPDSEMVCSEDKNAPCRFELTDTETVLYLDKTALSPGNNTLTVAYPADEQQDRAEGINHYSVSWVFRVI